MPVDDGIHPAPAPAGSGRLVSVDALRGFDMLWIMGGDSIGRAFAAVAGAGLMGHVAEQLEHVAWEGFRFYDLIFPLFVFLAGISAAFSLGRLVETEGKDAALLRVFKRTLLLYLLGVFYYGGLAGRLGADGQWSGRLEDIRLLGVLQRIALCYGAAGFLFVLCSRRMLWVALGFCLIGYWALMTFVPVPGIGAGSFAEGRNLANWLDARYLPWRKWDGTHDPEGLLSTLPAIGTCLMGVLSGLLLKDRETGPARKSVVLAVAGCVSLVAGYLWGIQFPIIKKLWTSSFVLVSGGWSLLLLAVFHQLVDVWRWDRWCRPFVWVGSNALLIYMVSNLVDFDRLASRFVGGNVSRWLDGALGTGHGALGVSLFGIGLGVLLARMLHQKKVFVRL